MKKITMLIITCLCLGACGVKPNGVEPPDDNKKAFPRTYPDMATDPQ